MTDAVPRVSLPAPHPRRPWWLAGAGTVLIVLALGGFYAHHVWELRHPQPPQESKVVKPAGTVNSPIKVWVNTDSGTYHCPGTRWYGKTRAGEYMTQKEAQDKGYRPAANRACI